MTRGVKTTYFTPTLKPAHDKNQKAKN